MTSTASHCRPREHLVTAGQLYPQAWRQVDQFREARGTGSLPAWPEWCFLPLAAAYAIVSADAGRDRLDVALAGDVGRLGALAAWRVTQGIYRFDPAVYDAVCDTPLAGDIPCDVLYRLPEWCVYIETPGLKFAGRSLHGVFAHLEWDAGDGRSELRLLLDAEGRLEPMPLHLGPWPLAESVERMLAESRRVSLTLGEHTAAPSPEVAQAMAATCAPIVSLLLYLCSQASEIGDGLRRPSHPQPVRVKRRMRLFPPPTPTTWDVGLRMGAALRRAYHAEQTGAGTHAGPRPHIRRAHWHGYWRGPRDGDRDFSLRWMPPIPVNVETVDVLPATVRRVGGGA